MDKKITTLVFGMFVLLVGVVLFSAHKDWIRQQFSMQTTQYDNGQGTTFTMQFYKNAEVIPAKQRKISFDPEHPPLGNIITEQQSDAGLTIAIGKAKEMDPEVQVYCSDVANNPFSYTAKANGNSVPVCALRSNDADEKHALYLTQVEGKGGRHLVQIYKDFNVDGADDEQKATFADTLDLRQHRSDIIHILSSIEEK